MAIMRQRWTVHYARWPLPHGCFLLPRAPAFEIESVTYQDSQGDAAEVEESFYTLRSPDGRMPELSVAGPDVDWPRSSLLASTRAPIEIVYDAGEISATKVTEQVKLAIRAYVARWYDQRHGAPVRGGTQDLGTMDAILSVLKRSHI